MINQKIILNNLLKSKAGEQIENSENEEVIVQDVIAEKSIKKDDDSFLNYNNKCF